MQRLTETKLKSFVLSILGDSDITVELEETDWVSIFERVLARYNKYRPKLIDYPLAIISGKQEYNLKASRVGRGVFDIVFVREMGDAYFALFDSSYFPLNFGGYRLDTGNFLDWKTFHRAQQQVYGTEKDFDFNPDTNLLKIYPKPTIGETVNLVTGHDRYFLETLITSGDGAATTFIDKQLKDSEGFPLVNLVPGIRIVANTEIFRDNKDGTLTSNKGGDGSINYETGIVTLNFNDVPIAGQTINAEVFELRTSDITWYQDYALALAKIIVGYKRRRFSDIPGQQASINLDVAIKDDGSEELKELEDSAKNWLVQLLIPRQL